MELFEQTDVDLAVFKLKIQVEALFFVVVNQFKECAFV